MDLSALSDDDLKKLAAGDMRNMSDHALHIIAGQAQPPQEMGGLEAIGRTAAAVGEKLLPQNFKNVIGTLKGEADLGRKVAGGIGKVGKAATEAITDISPTAGKAAEFLLPQDEAGGYAATIGGPIGAELGAGAFNLAKGAFKPLSAGAQNIVQYAASKGIKLTPAELGGSRMVQMLENALEKTPFGSQEFEAGREKTIAAIKALRDNIAGRLGTREDATVLDEIAQNAVKAAKAEHSAQVDALYGKVGELAAGKAIPMPRQAQAAVSLIEQELKLAPNRRNGQIMKAAADVLGIQDLEQITPELIDFIKKNPTAHTLDYANYSGNRRLLGDIIQSDAAARAMGSQYSSAESGAAKLLFKEGEKDLAAFSAAEGGELAKAHDAATSLYKEGRAMFDNKTIKKLIRSDPGALVDAVIRPTPASVNSIRAVKSAAGGESGAAWQALKKQFVEKLIPQVEDGFSPQSFQKILDKYHFKVLEEVFTKKELMEIKALARVSKLVGSAGNLPGTQGSARSNITAANMVLSGAAGVAGTVMGGPVAGAVGSTALVLGPGAMAKLYLSDTGRRLLMEGFKTPLASPKAAKVAGAITGYLAMKGVSEKR